MCVCVSSLRDLHMKRRHRGRLVDVTSLGMSVVDWHRRMEGGEELRRSCIEEEKEKNRHFLYTLQEPWFL